MSDPKRVGSVWAELPFMRGPRAAEQLEQWARQQAEVRRQCAARRARVLAHDWARKRLCRIFGYSNAEHWNGYVPPVRNPDGDLNTSPFRRALMDLLRDVERYENGGAVDGADQVDQAGA